LELVQDYIIEEDKGM